MNDSKNGDGRPIEGQVSDGPAVQPVIVHEILTITEAADYVRVSRSTMARMAIEKVVPCAVIRIGKPGKDGRRAKRIFRFRRQELERWFAAQQRQFAQEKR